MWSQLPHPIIALAPMAGYTDTAFRQIVKMICPQAVCFTEFTSVDGIIHGNEATRRQIQFNASIERPIVAQIFGNSPKNFTAAARILTELGVDAIDINMGCPAKKIVSSDHGSALLENPNCAIEIVQATCAGTHLPVSVKTRIGIKTYEPDFFIPFVQSVERAGAALITIHGRTATQMYRGTADWEPIYEAKRNLSIPVIGNGDVVGAKDAQEKLGNLDGLMIGRASFGNPWILREIASALHKNSMPEPTPQQRLEAIVKHLNLSIATKGELYGVVEMRKHFAWYVRGMPHASQIREKLVRCATQEEAMRLCHEVFQPVFSGKAGNVCFTT